MNNYFIKNSIIFDKQNLQKSARHSQTHNRYLNKKNPEEIEKLLVQEIISRVKANDFENGCMENIFDMWFVVEVFSESTQFNSEPEKSNPPKYQANIFVRLGRGSILYEVGNV